MLNLRTSVEKHIITMNLCSSIQNDSSSLSLSLGFVLRMFLNFGRHFSGLYKKIEALIDVSVKQNGFAYHFLKMILIQLHFLEVNKQSY